MLLEFDFKPSLERLIPSHIQNPTERLDQLLQRKDALETGIIRPNDFILWAIDILGGGATEAQFQHAWRQIFTVNKPMWEYVAKLKDLGHRLILFSNINAIHCPWIFDAYPEFANFEHAVLSFETGFIKPQREIYQFAIASHGLIPANTFYIDDMAENIAVGKAFGFQCWQYNINEHPAFELWLLDSLNSS